MVTGFVKAKDKSIVNGRQEAFLLKGLGLGGWLLPEGYMWQLPQEGDRPRKIEAYLSKAMGGDKAKEFWKEYKKNFITEKDIEYIKKSGFNSIRLPFNSRLLLEDDQEFIYLDDVVDWCEKHRLYVILDMHGAPGGQTGTNIDDSMNDQPELFQSLEYQRQAIELWKQLAMRYKDRWIIAGYDLLNEPLPEWFGQYNDQVMPLYEKMIKAIRSVDKEHMIILEGVHWSTDWSIFKTMPDDNIMLEFHKYWNNPDVESIQKYLDLQDKLNVPIFMGEGGENNLDWYTGAFHMFTQANISWNFWTYKKMDNTNSLTSIKRPEDWTMICQGLEKGRVVEKKHMEKILNEFIQNSHFNSNKTYPQVSRAIFRNPPVKVAAIFYDYKGENKSFHSKIKENNSIGFRIKDGLECSFINSHLQEAEFNHGGGENWKDYQEMQCVLKENEWAKYTFNITETEYYSLGLIYTSKKNTEVTISLGNSEITKTTGPQNKVTETVIEKVSLDPGEAEMKIKVVKGQINLAYICLEYHDKSL